MLYGIFMSFCIDAIGQARGEAVAPAVLGRRRSCAFYDVYMETDSEWEWQDARLHEIAKYCNVSCDDLIIRRRWGLCVCVCVCVCVCGCSCVCLSVCLAEHILLDCWFAFFCPTFCNFCWLVCIEAG